MLHDNRLSLKTKILVTHMLGILLNEGHKVGEGLRAYSIHSSPELRWHVAETIGLNRLSGLEPELRVLLSDRDARVRTEAYRSLLDLKPADLYSLLVQARDDQDPSVRRIVIVGLLEVNRPVGMEELRRASLEDSDRSTRDWASIVLEKELKRVQKP